MECDRVWTNARLATVAPDASGLGIVENGVIAARDGMTFDLAELDNIKE